MIPEDKKSEIRDRADIVSVVGDVVPLKRAGSAWKGLCPFHQEKSPSFFVTPSRQLFHCYGCGAIGDVFAFVMRFEGLSFMEAARRLAEKVGVELPEHEEDREQRAEADRQARRRERLFEINEIATRFFEECSRSEAGAAAREAIAKRGISDRVASAFRLGYAPDAWGSLAEHLRTKGVSPAEAEQMGLVKPRRQGPGHYDLFRHRLMFPVTGTAGKVVAFSGRALPGGVTTSGRDGDEPPKYVNSPETPIYRKGETVYGLHNGRVAIRRAEKAILVEGNFDLLAMIERGFDNVVAPMGTAFTVPQAKLLARSARQLVLLFDGDAAGQKAAHAAFDTVRSAGLEARVATLPDKLDPDEFLRSRGTEQMRALLESARGISEYLIDQAAARCGDGHESQAQAVRSLRPVLDAAVDPIVRQKLVDRVATSFGLMPHDARRLLKGQAVQARSEAGGGHTGHAPAELALLGAALDGAANLPFDLAAKVREVLDDVAIASAFDAVLTCIKGGVLDAPALLEQLEEDPEIKEWVGARLCTPEMADPEKAMAFLEEGARTRRGARRKAASQSLTEQIRRAQAAGDEGRALELLRAKMDLT
ncbi:MAG: DNA primase [Deltaproteobacteria bacterium]|nr:DNA primase [Deltaproteobacteria bacterium]